PINGVLVTTSVSDLLQQSAAERDLHAQALRTRVQELYQALGLRIPVYVLVTKSDLLAGFSEFFSALGKEERAQAWGFALPYGNEGLDPASMTAELQRLERRLYDRLPERLEEERDAPRPALRLSSAVRAPARPPRAVRRGRVRPDEARGQADHPRHLLHERHARREPHRPRDGRARARVRPRAQAHARSTRDRQELL